ncbi:PREDICTED: protein trapped in endoderm-1-like [Priapulus caudatus]|uniref:Protein trapped in endoderm-1-like n=1 Tax=Priapulus caudatus TaxID=37621 RepID=A0ABM1EDC8_PRICU|nr:PREDICTED: protein trapped in endoderm-1-like [Priapulus caudatus]
MVVESVIASDLSDWRYNISAYNASAGANNGATVVLYSAALCHVALFFCVLYVVVGVPCNLLTVAALLRSRPLRTSSTNQLVVNLAIADLIFCAVSLPVQATRYVRRAWTLGAALCRAFPLVFYGNLAVSIMTMMMIAVNRYLVVVHGALYRRACAGGGATAAAIVFCWAFAGAMLMPTYAGAWGEFGYVAETFSCSFLAKDGRDAQPYLFTIGVGVPLAVIVPCYARIIAVARAVCHLSITIRVNLG